ncbi:hypothetical protein VPK24_04830 [Limnothrix redekei LRLZ20PSL1]|uniref:Uncharacterized protein n=1 Tax=Limnothrix redekei LRLZ20PSL1 TaxID=3112953 RepID=A0ABW7C7D6_9CYAN
MFNPPACTALRLSAEGSSIVIDFLKAAINLQKAASPVVSVCGADEADFTAMKQEVS